MGEGDLFQEVLKIKTDVRALQHQTSWLLRSQGPELQQYWKPAFALDEKRPNYTAMRVYLAVNGKRTINEIAQNSKVLRPNASVILTQLEKKYFLIEPLPQKTSLTKVYAKTPADRALGITSALEAALAAKATTSSKPAKGGNSGGA